MAKVNRIIVVMGVTGSGKSTVGRALAARLGCACLDADEFHPPANVAKMERGEPLTDADRLPWLDAMHARLTELAQAGHAAVLACSALKQAYRHRLAADLPRVDWVYLRITQAAAKARVAHRTTHFMPASLVESQFETLEEPPEALSVDAEAPLETVVTTILERLGH